MGSFDLKDFGSFISETSSDSAPEIDFATAQDECRDVVDELSADVSGIGPKAAERYLLRYEFGFSTKTLAEKYGVTSPAITKHTRSVRERVLKYPTLAQIVGQFRSKKADLKDPIVDENLLWEGQFETKSEKVDAHVRFHPGDFSVPYSWMYSLVAKTTEEEMVRHLMVYYIVDSELGVFIKRSLKGVSHSSWRRTPHFQNNWEYTVYPLPNPKIPNKDGTLIDAIEHHATYDMAKAFDLFDWRILKMYAKSNTNVERPSASLSLPDVLLDRVRQENSLDAVHDYSHEIHIRNNIEHLLRLYPLISPIQIPLETVKQIWNGSLTRPESTEASASELETALETSRISIEPGYRNP